MDRFWSKVDRRGPDECWLWMAGRDSDGYGLFRLDRSERAHRVAYDLLVGPVPDGLELDHLCRNPPCVNPAHLESVTHRENVLRGTSLQARNAVKTHCPQGHPYSGDNLYRYADGRRTCRICHRVAGRARYAANPEKERARWHRRRAAKDVR